MSSPVPSGGPNVEALRAIYTDLTRLEDYAADDIVLHEAERGLDGSHYFGKRAAVAKELELIRLTGDSLVMDVHQIMANDHYGTTLGVLRADRDGQELAVPFCGVWRFRAGLIVEHWENAYDVHAIQRFLNE